MASVEPESHLPPLTVATTLTSRNGNCSRECCLGHLPNRDCSINIDASGPGGLQSRLTRYTIHSHFQARHLPPGRPSSIQPVSRILQSRPTSRTGYLFQVSTLLLCLSSAPTFPLELPPLNRSALPATLRIKICTLYLITREL
jgi:hypothetical protein